MAYPKDLKSASELAVNHPHGTRIKYKGGCRCLPCKSVNSRYESERRQARKNKQWNGLVSAEAARRHILELSASGIGYKTVADASGAAPSIVFKIRSGEKKQIRAESERKILSVTKDAVCGKTIISAQKTWRQIRWLLSEGFTKSELARRLGYKNRALQVGKERVTAANAMKVEKFYNQIRLGE